MKEVLHTQQQVVATVDLEKRQSLLGHRCYITLDSAAGVILRENTRNG